MENDYYLGLDIGTNSVGWAVTDESYGILKFRGNAMWGIRLFEEAQTAETRRSFRQGRRRIQRRKDRLLMLEMLFNEEISKVDPAFYQRLYESNLYSEDKSVDVPYAVFADENYNDKDYHHDYPTIYHLRYELINNEKPHDIRLVYLALHHIIKNRGHFLSDISSDSDGINDFNYLFDDFADYANENIFFGDDCTRVYLSDEDKNKFSEIIKDRKLGKNAKKAETEKLFNINRKNNKQFYAMLCLLCGLTGNLSDVFADDSLKDNKISFSSGFEEHEDEYRSLLGEKFELLEKLKAVYDWALLEEILNGCDYLSEAKVKVYEKHKSDLKKLKAYVKKYFPEKYNDIFKKSNKGICNYAAYSAHVKTNNGNGVVEGTANQETFCSFLKKELGKECLSVDEADKQVFAEIEDGIFMPKQRSASNGVIPMQLNEKELKAILDNAKEYLPFLISKDENGICVYEKIIKIFEYRIPYYVGPLNTVSPKSWLIRKPGKIYPWNIEEKVDFDKSAEAFIDNLTSKCTYLPKFDVIPKNSLLYSKFMVLDELNNLRIDGEKISVELKQAIYKDCFMKYKKVSKKSLERYLQSRNIEYTTLSGFDNDFSVIS